MPTKITKTQMSIEAAAALPPVPTELIDLFCTGPMTGEAGHTGIIEHRLLRQYFRSLYEYMNYLQVVQDFVRAPLPIKLESAAALRRSASAGLARAQATADSLAALPD
ncbi:MAG: hypothetical protein ABI040_02760 [Rhodoferax sp.]